MVTAELAIALPTLLLVVLSASWIVGLLACQGTVEQAAREGARAAARGDSMADIRRSTAQLVPGAHVRISRDVETVRVTVALHRNPRVRFLAPLGRELVASATSWVEQP